MGWKDRSRGVGGTVEGWDAESTPKPTGGRKRFSPRYFKERVDLGPALVNIRDRKRFAKSGKQHPREQAKRRQAWLNQNMNTALKDYVNDLFAVNKKQK